MPTAKKTTTKKTPAPKGPKYAVIVIAGSQMLVEEGKTYEIQDLNLDKGETLALENVLLVVQGNDVKVGKPTVRNAKVTLEVESQKQSEKLTVFKYKAKSRYRRTYGQRSVVNRVRVKSIKA
jgi:large subunit ribosomal protein L21